MSKRLRTTTTRPHALPTTAAAAAAPSSSLLCCLPQALLCAVTAYLTIRDHRRLSRVSAAINRLVDLGVSFPAHVQLHHKHPRERLLRLLTASHARPRELTYVTTALYDLFHACNPSAMIAAYPEMLVELGAQRELRHFVVSGGGRLLTRLRLDCVSLTSDMIADLAHSTTLQALHLAHCQLDQMDTLMELARCPQLDTLTVWGGCAIAAPADGCPSESADPPDSTPLLFACAAQCRSLTHLSLETVGSAPSVQQVASIATLPLQFLELIDTSDAMSAQAVEQIRLGPVAATLVDLTLERVAPGTRVTVLAGISRRLSQLRLRGWRLQDLDLASLVELFPDLTHLSVGVFDRLKSTAGGFTVLASLKKLTSLQIDIGSGGRPPPWAAIASSDTPSYATAGNDVLASLVALAGLTHLDVGRQVLSPSTWMAFAARRPDLLASIERCCQIGASERSDLPWSPGKRTTLYVEEEAWIRAAHVVLLSNSPVLLPAVRSWLGRLQDHWRSTLKYTLELDRRGIDDHKCDDDDCACLFEGLRYCVAAYDKDA